MSVDSAERAAVKKGAALLDKLLPGWHNHVNLDQLYMQDGEMCMMGQLFGHGVESALAKAMYPDEMKKLHDKNNSVGYDALAYSFGDSRNFVYHLMEEQGIANEMYNEYRALQLVCSGHDNKCIWAEEIADRKAAEVTDETTSV